LSNSIKTKTMSKSFLVPQEFQSLAVAQSKLNISNAGTSITLGNAQSGDVILLNATGGSSVMLPAPRLGLNYTFIVSATAAGHVVSAPTATIMGALSTADGRVTVGSLVSGAAKTSILSTTGSVVGDQFSLVASDTQYFLRGVVSNFNGAKFA
jgi:hypothetical protein